MKKRQLALAGATAALPFIGMDAAKAAPSDCWFAKGDDDLEYFACDVTKYRHSDGGNYYEVEITPTASAEVTLWVDNNGDPTEAEVIYTSDKVGPHNIGGDYIIDSDGDVRLALGNNDAMLVFRFPDHEFAGTGCSGDGCYEQASRPTQPVYRNNPPSDGLQRGTLRDTPFRF